jgi:hypothetical protein
VKAAPQILPGAAAGPIVKNLTKLQNLTKNLCILPMDFLLTKLKIYDIIYIERKEKGA